MQAKPQKHILIVDDDQDLRELMTEVLVSEGYTVSSASDGQVGLDFLNACRMAHLPNLIILDSQMPRLNGAQFIEALASLARPELKKIPIILSSGMGGDVTTGGIPPRVTRLQKPFELNELFQTIEWLS